MLPVPREKWFRNDFCPPQAILPPYIRNPSLFSGNTNNPAMLVQQTRQYSRIVDRTILGRKTHTTLILPVPQRARRRLSNPIS
jgi:hypothetical protein